MTNVVLDRLRQTCGTRHGLIGSALAVPRSAADPPGVHHASVADDLDALDVRSAGGGVGRTAEWAEVAALAEALERYAASVVDLAVTDLPANASSTSAGASEVQTSDDDSSSITVIGLNQWTLHSDAQRSDPAFPYTDGYPETVAYTTVYSLLDNSAVLVPATLVALRREYGALATSSGLAADFSRTKALLRAIQELVERDAYVTTWTHGLAGRQRGAAGVDHDVNSLGGQLNVYDITPAYSPHHVACVAGSLPLRGVARNSLGLACRSTWSDAVEKAYLEFVQGTMFAGHKLRQFPQLAALRPETCTGFDEHALFWSVHHTDWWDLPLHGAAGNKGVGTSSELPRTNQVLAANEPAANARQEMRTQQLTVSEELAFLTNVLSDNGVRLFYRLLPAAGLDQIGLHVVRALSPDLVPLHHNHNWPFLGGTASNRAWRYPDAAPQTRYPSPFPHALG